MASKSAPVRAAKSLPEVPVAAGRTAPVAAASASTAMSAEASLITVGAKRVSAGSIDRFR